MLEQIAKNICERKLFRDGERILVAVSGGVDSMVLLHLLHRLARECGWRLAVAHLNHKLRGPDSEADERLVRKVAKAMRLPIVVEAADVKSHAAKSGQSIEMAARQLRHAFLVRAAKRLKIKTVALAHHADDQVELFFLRLLRGTSAEGLAGMRWRRRSPAGKAVQLVRPLLNVSRAQLESFAKEQKIVWREDKTNLATDFMRNRIRRELIPLLEKGYQPALRKNVLRLMEVLREESEVVTSMTKTARTANRNFSKLPVAIQRRLLQQQLFELGLNADFETIENLRLNTGKVVELNPATRLVRDEGGRLRLAKIPAALFSDTNRTVRLKAKATKADFAGCAFTFRTAEKPGTKFEPRANTESFDAAKIGRVIVLRHWRPGDRFHAIGAKSARKLQDMFVDLKIPKEERHGRVVATTATGEIFWVEGLRIGERFKLTTETKRRLVLQWQRR